MSLSTSKTPDLSEWENRIAELLKVGDWLSAERSCKWLLDQEVEYDRVWFYLGAAYIGKEQSDRAISALEKATEKLPRDVEAWNALAYSYSKAGMYEKAFQAAECALNIAPNSSSCLANMGVAWQQLKNFKKAIEYYKAALAINPREATAVINLASDLVKLQRMEEAQEYCLSALKSGPQPAALYNNLAEACIHLSDFKAALVACDCGISIEPRFAGLHLKRGLVLSYMARFKEAQASLIWAQVIQPDIVREYFPYWFRSEDSVKGRSIVELDARQIFLNVAYYRQQRCDWRMREGYLATVRQQILDDTVPYPLPALTSLAFQMLSMPFAPQERLKLMRQISRRMQPVDNESRTRPFNFMPIEKAKLRIGYISPDFRMHPTAILTAPIYGMHDRERFEIYAYSLYHHTEDSMRQRIIESVDVFRDVMQMTSKEIATLVYEDNIDILVDLAGCTTHSRPDALAMRPAPITVSYVGYSGTQGADYIDYAIDNQFSTTDELRQSWHEALIRMPYSHFPFDTTVSNLPVALKREDFDLPDNAIVFCCFNTNYKIEPLIFGCWMNVLQAVPDSVLWLLFQFDEQKVNLRKQAEQHGVDPDRLIFSPYLPHSEHVARYQLADLFLDTCWHNAHTTAMEALWQGLPVLTCSADVISSRWAGAFLQSMEMPELVAYSFDEYEALAIEYASSRNLLQKLKEKTLHKRDSTPLFDNRRVVDNLERAYTHIWDRFVKGLPPASFDL